MTNDVIRDIQNLSPDELLIVKAKVITIVDKKKYAKEILSGLDRQDAQKTIDWLKARYNI